MKTNHPAHGPVSLERLHQIREILSKAAAQSDGGNLGYAMADAVKVIDGAIAAFGADQVTLIKPVSDLYGITSPTGSETTFTFDAGEASSFAKGGWTVQEYVELERYQQAMAGNSPVTPDGWKVEAERLAEVHGCSFVVFRHGEEPQCADPTKVIISFTDEGLGHH